MQIPFYISQNLTAINTEVFNSTLHIGVLLLPPKAEEIQQIKDVRFHLTTDLIGKDTPLVALENEFDLADSEV